MSSDLKWIKKHYSEKLMHICRENFPTLLEQEGLLKKILSEHFAQSESLGKDLEDQDKIPEFKDYIYSFVDVENGMKLNFQKTAEQLMDEAGYILYPECQTESDIQSFKKYYCKGEKLCTFNGGRLNRCRVWFAVKKDVDEIKREDFKNPLRQDEYGTSVISIQFTHGGSSTLSIKNRYNHTVSNPDATFSNNLDNIISGLTQAFIEEYGINLTNGQTSSFVLDNYVKASDGKYYRYNMEINNIYYCENNVIIDNFEVKKLDPRYVLMDYFVVDLSTNTIKFYDKNIKDSFIETLGEIERITYEADMVRIKVRNSEDVLITLDEHRAINKLSNPNLTECGNGFMHYNQAMTSLSLPNLTQTGTNFMHNNRAMKELSLPNLTKCGDDFLYYNKTIAELSLPNLTRCGEDFLYYNQAMTELSLPNLTECCDRFMPMNVLMTELSLPNLTECGTGFMYDNRAMTKLDMPNLTQCGRQFMYENRAMIELNLPNLTKCGSSFMEENKVMTKLNLPKLTQCGEGFMYENRAMIELSLPNLTQCGDNFMYCNEAMTSLSLPKLSKCGDNFMSRNRDMAELSLPNLTQCGAGFMYYNHAMTELSLPNLTQCGDNFMYGNHAMKELSLPNLTQCGDNFLYWNEAMTELSLPNLTQCGDSFMYENQAMTEMDLPKLRECGVYFMQNNKAMRKLILSKLQRLREFVSNLVHR